MTGPFISQLLADSVGSGWWLPTNYSLHGRSIDALFAWIFWITLIVFVGVQATLIGLLIKYRRRPDKAKAVFTHGNAKLEFIWMLIPAIILGILAIASRGVWNQYQSADEASLDVKPASILVIGEQFKWNIIYPGPDGKFGKYLVFPKPTDAAWPVDGNGKPIFFSGVAGPRDLPRDEALFVINSYIIQLNPLGKVMDDPDGRDDLWQGAIGRVMEVPLNRPVEVILGSKDVIHSFSLPNFRVKLDTVPGMTGRIRFTPTILSKDLEAQGKPGYFDIVCQELCGLGHYTMQGQLIVIDPAEYTRKYETASAQ